MPIRTATRQINSRNLWTPPGYAEQVRRAFGTNLVAYWPMGETRGTIIADISGNGRNGATAGSTGPTLGAEGIGDGRTAPSFPGGNGFINVYSTNLRDAWPGANGSFMCWAKVASAAVWTNVAYREFVNIEVDGNNCVWAGRTTAATNALYCSFRAGGTIENYGVIGISTTGWFHFALTWSKANERTRVYLNGALWGSTATLGTWTGSLSSSASVLGAVSTGGSEGWNGSIAHALVLNREATPEEIDWVAMTGRSPKRFVIIADSIASFSSFPNGWLQQVRDSHNGGNCMIHNYANAGDTILANMDGQVVSAASKDADVIICTLGTNDNDAGNMTTLQAEVEENLAELKGNHPGAKCYYMNVLPVWTDNTTGPEVDKSHIRAAIAAACTAQGFTCWDTRTSPWITQAQTSDGLHPTAAGMAAIATEVLARL